MLGWRDMAYYHSDPWRGTWKGEGGGVLINQAPHQIDLLLWYMGEVEELYGMWDTLNHPELEVEDTAACVIRFKNGAIGNIVVSNSQNPALFGNVRVHGSNGASVGVQTDGGAMFIAGVSGIAEPPVNDLWTVEGEADQLEAYKAADREFFTSVNSTDYFHTEQLSDFLKAIQTGGTPLITLEAGRQTVELITGIYRSMRDGKPVRFPLKPEYGTDFDGRLKNV
jgi:predicted dehydrogenase